MISDKFSQLSLREKAVLALAGMIVLVVILFYLVVRPVRNWFADIAQQIVTLQEHYASNQRVLSPAYRTAVEQDYQRYEQYMQPHGSPAEENGQMQSAIVELAGQAGVTLGGTKPREAPIGELTQEYAVDVEVEASLGNLVKFLHALRESPQLLRVEKMTVTPKGRGETQDVKGTLTITKLVFL